MAELHRLPEGLCAFADAALPGLRAAQVEFRFGPRLPFDWLPGDRQRFSAITLWNAVHVRDRGVPFDPLAPHWLELVLHELVHVAQYARLGSAGFPAAYVLGLARHGYHAHPLEHEAREKAAELVARFTGGGAR
jgi:hypothetical protein